MTIKLTVELVPKTCWYSNVRDHVDEPTWDRLRRDIYKQANYKCQICGETGKNWPVECHEVWTYDDQNKVQKLIGMIALCPSCHQVKHLGFANQMGRADIAKKHLAKINNWTQIQVDKYAKQVFSVWVERSKYQWILDLSWLEKYGITVASQRT